MTRDARCAGTGRRTARRRRRRPPNASSPATRIVPVTINGTPARLRIDPGAPGVPLISAELAERAGLKGGGMLGSASATASARSPASSHRRWSDWISGDGPFKRRIGWGSARLRRRSPTARSARATCPIR